MALLHSVYDTDAHFKIDAVTRAIRNDSSGKTVLIQGDHNSERFTFEVPRLVDGHDLSLCNVAQIHYINIDSSNKSNTSTGVYESDDFQISPDSDDVVILSWLISGNATKYAGSLNFLVKFKCVDDSGKVVYVWNTAIFTGISVSSGINNGEAIVEEYADVLEQWRQELTAGTVSDEQIAAAVDAYMQENPVSGGTGTVINYDLNVKAINHRGYSTTAPENTIPAYIMSKKKGFTYAECDVSFTSDGVAVLLHDATINRTSDGSGSISAMTYAEALQYDFGSWKSSAYTGTKIATFDEFIMLCKAIGLHPYIELKSNGAYTQDQITGIATAVKNTGMQGKVTYISFNATFLEYVKTADSSARLGYLVSSVTDAVITTANGLKTDTNEVFVDSSDYDADAIAKCQAANLPLEIWTINNSTTIENMNGYISGVTSDNLIAGKILYDKYMTYTAPETPDTGGGGDDNTGDSGDDSGNTGDSGNDNTGDVDDTIGLIRTIAADELTVGACAETYNESTGTYQSNNNNRLSYLPFDIKVAAGATYKVEYDTDYAVSNIGVTEYSQAALDRVANNLSWQWGTAGVGNNFMFDSGWKDNGYEFTTRIDYPTKAVRFSFRLNTGNTAMKVGDIKEVRLYRLSEPTPVYTITRNLTNCNSSNALTGVKEGSSHTETLTVNNLYTLTGADVSITMNGVDITKEVYSNGVITIPEVTGDIVINASAVEAAIEAVEYDVTESLVQCGINSANNTVGYINNSNNRVSYIGTEILVSAGDVITISVNSENIKYGVRVLNESNYEAYLNTETFSLFDSTWINLPNDYTIPETVNNGVPKCIWLTFALIAPNNGAIAPADLGTVKVYVSKKAV